MNSDLTPAETRLLASYDDGPRIWDATELVPTVASLAARGLIAPTTDTSAAYALTDAGRTYRQQKVGGDGEVTGRQPR